MNHEVDDYGYDRDVGTSPPFYLFICGKRIKELKW